MLVRPVTSGKASDDRAFVEVSHPELVHHHHLGYHSNPLRALFAVTVILDVRVTDDILFSSAVVGVPSMKVCRGSHCGAIHHLVLVSSPGGVQGSVVCLIKRPTRVYRGAFCQVVLDKLSVSKARHTLEDPCGIDQILTKLVLDHQASMFVSLVRALGQFSEWVPGDHRM